jgi:hypothetical protein
MIIAPEHLLAQQERKQGQRPPGEKTIKRKYMREYYVNFEGRRCYWLLPH